MIARDPAYEADWLHTIEREAGVDVGWGARVRARLQWAQGKHGDRWTRMLVRGLFREIRAECEDLGGWPVLAAQMIVASKELPDAEAMRLLGLLRQIAAYGAMADELVDQAISILGDR